MGKGATEQVGGILPTLHLGQHLAFAAEETEKRSSFLLSRWETDSLLAKTLLRHRMRLPSTVSMPVLSATQQLGPALRVDMSPD